MDFFQKGLTPPLPPQTFGTFGSLFRRLIFFWNFWGTFCVVFHQNQGKKRPKTFGFGQPPLFSTKKSKIVGAHKSAPLLLDWPGTPHPPLWKIPKLELHFRLQDVPYHWGLKSKQGMFWLTFISLQHLFMFKYQVDESRYGKFLIPIHKKNI